VKVILFFRQMPKRGEQLTWNPGQLTSGQRIVLCTGYEVCDDIFTGITTPIGVIGVMVPEAV
jgi:hypothetical protein